MHTVHTTPAISLTSRSSRDMEADLLVIPVFENDDLADEVGLDEASGGDIGRARLRGEFTGKAFDVFFSSLRGWKANRVALMGVGPRRNFAPDGLRRAATTAGLAARQRHMTRLAIVHRPGTLVSPDRAAQ